MKGLRTACWTGLLIFTMHAGPDPPGPGPSVWPFSARHLRYGCAFRFNCSAVFHRGPLMCFNCTRCFSDVVSQLNAEVCVCECMGICVYGWGCGVWVCVWRGVFVGVGCMTDISVRRYIRQILALFTISASSVIRV